MSTFLREVDFYGRDSNFFNNYLKQMATGLSIEFGLSKEEALEKIRGWQKEGRFTKLEKPVVEYFTKDDNDDRITGSMDLFSYIGTCVKERHILVPTFTAYFAPDVRESPLSGYVGDNVTKRAKAKKASQAAFAEKNVLLGFMKDAEQKNKKENNNSLSGLKSAESSIFQNDTGHNTLTSITRSMASVANALNERIIGGNRHYRDINSAINNSLAIIETTDLNQVRITMAKYGMRAPTVDELMSVYEHSMKFYVFDFYCYAIIKELVVKMTDEQRAIVAYSQDLYHVKVFNREMCHGMLAEFAHAEIIEHFEEPAKFIYSQDELTSSFAHQVCIDAPTIRGNGKKYDKMDPQTVQLIANVCKNIETKIEKYRDFFHTFFLTRTVPNNTAYIQDMVRTTVVLSDTDSTMFSVDQWVMDYFGKLDFTGRGFAIAGTVAFISSQVNAHCIAILSGNMGVPKHNIFRLSMKPEFGFPVFFQSPVSKHYFTAKLICEGSVYEELDMEIKGVHNRNSAISDVLNDETHAMMKRVIEDIMKGKGISLGWEVKDLIRVEDNILESLRGGSPEFFKRTSIKTPHSYSVEDPVKKSIYAFHTLWMQVFSQKYGEVPEPNYEVVKVPTTLKTKTRFNKWLESFKDQAMADRFRQWMVDHNKSTLKTLYFSIDHLEGSGMPEEVVDIIDYNKIVLDLTLARRMALDSFGYTPRPDYRIREMVGLA